MVVRSDGEILFHNDSTYSGSKIEDPEILNELENSLQVTVQAEKDNTIYYYSIVPIGNESKKFNLSAIVTFPASLIDVKVNALRNYTIGFAVLSLALAVILLFGSITFLVIFPLSHLIAAIKKIRGGTDLNTRVTVTSKDELGILANSFNQMTQDLQKTTTSVDNLNREITERKKVEAKLKELMQDLSRSNQELEQFAYVASHDLQEPLRMVSSYLQLLEARNQDKLDFDSREFIGFAVDGANRMSKLIQDLLTYSRVGTKGKKLMPTESLNVYNKAIKNLEVSISEHKATIIHDTLPRVMADEGQLIQLFQNLIGNSLKFCRDELPKIQILTKAKENKWIFGIKDNGIGIAPEYQERVFQIFQRLHTRSEYEGTGIGLAVCKKIVERHGGDIWIESEEGKGTTFWFSLSAS
jgi:signal transduction histidine kinase